MKTSGLFRVATVASVLVTSTACNFDVSVPDIKRVRCTKDSQCPTGRKCQLSTSTCEKEPDATKPGLVDGTKLTIEPGPSSLIPAPTSVGPTATLRVEFQATESVRLPTVTSSCDAVVACSVRENKNPSFTFACVAIPGVDPFENPCEFSVTLVDDVNNVDGPFVLGTAVFDTLAPVEPAVDTADAVVFHRVPWGSTTTLGAVSMRLEVRDLAADLAIAVSESADMAALPFLIAPFGQGTIALPPVDRAALIVQALDSAGNSSPRRKVRDVQLVTTFGSSSGSGNNPNRFEVSAVQTPMLVQPASASTPLPNDILAATGDDSATTRGGGTWYQRAYTEAPPSTQTSAAYDSARGRAVTFGGCLCLSGAECSLGSVTTFEWNGENWLPIPTLDIGWGTPSPRHNHVMAYDAARALTVMFGGRTIPSATGTVLNETWLWNGESWRKVTTGTAPSARIKTTMAYDVKRQRTVLFGGEAADGSLLGDTWEWDGARWTEIALTAGTSSPSPRSGAAMTYDPTRGLVLTAGRTATGVIWDAWTFDGKQWSVEQALSTPAQTARAGHGMVYDFERKRLTIVGGAVGAADAGTHLTDMRTFDSATGWTTWPFSTLNMTGISARAYGRFVYDSARDSLLMAGGAVCIGNNFLRDLENGTTYNYRFGTPNAPQSGFVSTWRKSNLILSPPPAPRTLHAQAYDPNRKVTVIQGGEYGPSALDDTYDWNGQYWTEWKFQADAGAFFPGARSLHAMGYQPTLKKLVMFGGFGEVGEQRLPGVPDFLGSYTNILVDAGTWVGDPAIGWKPMPGVISPPARLTHGMTTNPITNELVMVGGTSIFSAGGASTRFNGSAAIFKEAWGFNGTTWRKYTSPLVYAVGVGLAFDTVRSKLVGLPGHFYVGLSPASPNEVIELDAAQVMTPWAAVPTTPTPPQRTLQNVIYDTKSERTLAYSAPVTGGAGSGLLASDRIWEWNGSAWQEATVSTAEAPVYSLRRDDSPGTRVGFRWTFDENRGRAVLFGGLTGDLWEYAYADKKPRHVVSIDLGGARVPKDAEYSAMSVKAVSGATSAVPQEPSGAWVTTNGAQIQPWYDGAWREVLATNTADTTTKSELAGTLSPNALGRIFSGTQVANLAITPVGTNGNGAAQVSTDYFEATVKYRLPAN